MLVQVNLVYFKRVFQNERAANHDFKNILAFAHTLTNHCPQILAET